MKKYRKRERYYYFRRQKIVGGIMVALGVISAIMLGGDITAAVFLVPFGLYVMFTKEMLLTNDDYYFEQNQKIERRESE